MDKLKYIKIESDDGTLSENVPIGTETQYVDIDGGLKIYKTI